MQFSYQLIILLFCSMSVLVEGGGDIDHRDDHRRRNLDRILDSSGYDYSSSKTPSCANVNYDMACIEIVAEQGKIFKFIIYGNTLAIKYTELHTDFMEQNFRKLNNVVGNSF